jgi:perosamine synthetase
MRWPIPRGRISHPVALEVKDLIHSTLFPKMNSALICEYELAVSKYLKSDVPVLFPFARTGLFSILELLNLPAGSRILMPTITIKPLLDVVLHFRLMPVLVDLDVNSGCWDPKSLETALRNEPSVALLTYLFGVVPNLDEILPKLDEANVIVIEDFSQAFGARFKGKSLGTLGDFAICSTSSTKTLDTYGGALIFTKDKSLQEYISTSRNNLSPPKKSTLIRKILKNLVRNLATNKLVFGLFTFPIVRLINTRSKLEVGKFTGSRSSTPLTTLPKEWFEGPCAFQAKVGLRELSYQEDKDRKRTAIANRYSNELKSLGPRGGINSESVYWQYISVQDRAIEFRNFLNSEFIDCATTSLVKLSELSEYGLALDLPATNTIYERGVYLPCYHQLSYKAQTRVIEAAKCFNERE